MRDGASNTFDLFRWPLHSATCAGRALRLLQCLDLTRQGRISQLKVQATPVIQMRGEFDRTEVLVDALVASKAERHSSVSWSSLKPSGV